MSQSLLPAKLNLPGARSYPPCVFNTQAEKDLYKRLRNVYETHCDTWDAEARDAWPVVVEHASLAPSTIGKITNHYITRHMQNCGVTWAHVVALRIMYEKQLYKSRKLMGLIRCKYPNASFETFAYSEDYMLSFKSEIAREAQEPTVPKTPAVEGSVQRRQGDGGLQLTRTPANNHHRELSKGAIEFLSEGNSSEDEPLMWNSSKKTKPPPAQNTTPKKRAAASNARNEGGAEPHRRTKKPRHAARGTTDVSPRSGEVKERTSEEQEDSIDVFDKFISAIKENTKATKENIRATEKSTKATEENLRAIERNTKATEEKTKIIKEMRARSKAVSKKATKDQNV
ncbi:uncharacterized protein TrAtP1_005932 [Trichoderma atroviride]|uniref:Uncharacterized protein n=1 Tax=Hypocrea atroviridis (strain ATCC 20476 / IMI 206040) TaxID=452589 RepID=G9PA78_HYPAI|nr:uncharacterized protein TRIATDRAFT_287662 [Trichoderma atroviride IMI 206040]EHK39916.1 hypothetical protein TRIATDRAFT_287662 [Trichoderma atroviride IMI 206040]UKZ64721.1 hypothetical protein TrAtP1_005932 [Trichoderma atroviride]